jgi:hypothetical protein
MPETPETPEELSLVTQAALIADAPAPTSEGEPPAAPESAQTKSASEPTQEPTPMLDGHPAHHAASTWKDFFIHIATIVIGLLIAVGIEQAVEHFHQREQVKQAREALDLERRKNIIISQEVAVMLRSQQAAYAGNLAALQFLRVHPGTPLDPLPAPIVGSSFTY